MSKFSTIFGYVMGAVAIFFIWAYATPRLMNGGWGSIIAGVFIHAIVTAVLCLLSAQAVVAVSSLFKK